MNDQEFPIGRILRELKSLPLVEHEAYLAKACHGNRELIEEIKSLKAGDDVADNLFMDHTDSNAFALALADSLSPSHSIPKSIGPYDVISILGEGGMGVVYRAEQKSPRRVVALKVIRPGYVTGQALKRFHYEVSLLGRLQHQGIAQIFDAGIAETPLGLQPYFAMELIEAEPLLVFAKNNRLSVQDRLSIFVKVCNALHHAHQKGIIHRDLKPGNILVTKDGGPKIVDFGIAKSTDDESHTTSMHTQVGQIMGTLVYMSPEHASGNPDEVDTRSDVYAMGVILFELLSGELPYPIRSKPFHEAIRLILDDDPKPLSRMDKAFRGDLETIVAKALEKDKERRYPSASELAMDIERFINDEPIIARPPTTFYQLSKFTRRHRALASVVVLTFTAVLVALIITGFALQDSRESERRARRAERRALSVSGIQKLQDLNDRAHGECWPLRPETAPLMQSWLNDAELELSHLPSYRDYLSSLDLDVDQRTIAEEDAAWLRGNLRSLIQNLGELKSGETSLVFQMQDRLMNALAIRTKTIEDCEGEWDFAIEEIAESSLYKGLELTPQLGLIPLDQDPKSGFWEFFVWESGDWPERDEENDRWIIGDTTGMILVLIPGGTFNMGASRNRSMPNYDPDARPNEAPIHEVDLDPFFVSKYEMTQGQWTRLMGSNPSLMQKGQSGNAVDLLKPYAHPVENVSWNDCKTALARLSLTIPTEAQWEFACRGGTDTPWWPGRDPSLLATTANVMDRALANTGGTGGLPIYGDWDDQAGIHAPAGRYTANPFGLHDVHGNVWEWTLDAYTFYADHVPRNGDGLRREGTPRTPRVFRGGGWDFPALVARSSTRNDTRSDDRNHNIGIRPARAIEP